MYLLHHSIPYTQLPSFNGIVKDYLGNQLAHLPYPTLHSIGHIINNKKFEFRNRQVLKSVLLEQYARLPNGNKATKTINKLLESETFTVTTAHQPNIFLGPLYVVYKSLSAIAIASQLAQHYPAFNFIPVFYIGSEDHDLEELNHINIYKNKLQWSTTQTGAVGSMNAIGLDTVIEEINNLLPESVYKEELMALFKMAYNGNNTIAKATSILLNELFGKYNLLIVDANHASFKQEFVTIIKDDITNNTAFKLLQNEPQLQAMPRPINLFYLTDNIRQRIIKTEEGYTVNNTNIQFSNAQLLELIEKSPALFSPNVILRPLYQETILPNVVFTGGSSEVAYWLQLNKVFRHYKTPMPAVMVRDSVLVLDNSAVKKMKQWDFSFSKLFDSQETLIQQYLSKQQVFDTTAQQLNLKNELEIYFKKLNQQWPNSQSMLAAQKVNFFKELEQVDKKIQQVAKREHSDALIQISTFKERLFPGGMPQERIINFSVYYQLFGTQWFDYLLQYFNPFEKKYHIFY
jgi:bacillithiol biosynthesis cysteine-adding enzyme BshC